MAGKALLQLGLDGSPQSLLSIAGLERFKQRPLDGLPQGLLPLVGLECFEQYPPIIFFPSAESRASSTSSLVVISFPLSRRDAWDHPPVSQPNTPFPTLTSDRSTEVRSSARPGEMGHGGDRHPREDRKRQTVWSSRCLSTANTTLAAPKSIAVEIETPGLSELRATGDSSVAMAPQPDAQEHHDGLGETS
jgi:hypothetical protein